MENCNVNLTGQAAYFQENQELAEKILEDQFYKYFSINTPHVKKEHRNLELIVSPKCNLKCSYCYINRYHDKLFDDNCYDAELTIRNLKLVCEWMRKNRYNCDIEIFSGELFAQEVGYQVLETLIEYYKSVEPEMRCKEITIPTNFTFICSEELTARVEHIRKELKDLGIFLLLSASFDGKYMEQNRKYKGDLDLPIGGLRDDDYYDRAFEYCFNTCGGFHPMVYSHGIELWPKNFDWFQQKFAEYDLPWQCIYLLQVRNMEWSKQQIKDMEYFIDYLYQFSAKQLDYDRSAVTDWIIKGQGFNMLAQPYTSTGRGLTCAIQSQFALRLSDLMLYPCHRTGYKDFYFGQFVPDDKNVLKYVNKNVELLCATFSIHKESLPYCAQCPINKLCTGTCLGAQYENTTNMYVPIPSVCLLTYAMSIANVRAMKKYGSWSLACNYANEDKLPQLEMIERIARNVDETL